MKHLGLTCFILCSQTTYQHRQSAKQRQVVVSFVCYDYCSFICYNLFVITYLKRHFDPLSEIKQYIVDKEDDAMK